jgi:hypothetical protein
MHRPASPAKPDRHRRLDQRNGPLTAVGTVRTRIGATARQVGQGVCSRLGGRRALEAVEELVEHLPGYGLPPALRPPEQKSPSDR